MYAIVEIAGQQFKVEKDQRVFVHRLEGKEGSKVEFDKVLLTDDKGNVNVGAPVIEGAKIQAEILQHLKGDKVIVFKKKRRKGYKVKNGHRQYFTEIAIKGINVSGGKAKAAATTAKKAAPKKEVVKKETTAKKESKPTKKAAEKKA